MGNFKFALLAFAMTWASHARSQGAPPMATADALSCNYYTWLESVVGCGTGGAYSYPIDYGLKYCNAFNNQIKNKTSECTRKELWAKHTLVCLQDQLQKEFVKILNNSSLMPAGTPTNWTTVKNNIGGLTADGKEAVCKQIKDAAFGSHAYCYTQGSEDYGGCNIVMLSDSDKTDIVLTVEGKDLATLDSLNQIMEAGVRCVPGLATGNCRIKTGSCCKTDLDCVKYTKPEWDYIGKCVEYSSIAGVSSKRCEARTIPLGKCSPLYDACTNGYSCRRTSSWLNEIIPGGLKENHCCADNDTTKCCLKDGSKCLE